jgi:diguanylate cyclase (GGDEF)-like protein
VSAVVGITIASMALGRRPAPFVPATLPLLAVFWAIADLIVATILTLRFTVSRVRYHIAVAATFVVTGLLAAAVVVACPDVFATLHPAGKELEIASALAFVRAFAGVAGLVASQAFCGDLRRVSRRRTSTVAILAWSGALAATVALAALTAIEQPHIPALVAAGGMRATVAFTASAYALACIRAAAAIGIYATRRGRIDALTIWLVATLAIGALGAGLSASTDSRHEIATYIALFETVAASAAILFALGFDLALSYHVYANLAGVDPLTGLANRRTFEEDSKDVISLAIRRNRPVSLLVVDIDHFKRYNDVYGHAGGDAALCGVSAVLESAARSSDIVARLGGEEFVVLLPDTWIEDATRIAEQIRRSVERGRIHNGAAGAHRLTVSVGVATMKARNHGDAERLFSLADRALYDAKHGGRNAVVASSNGEPSGVSVVAKLRS